MDFTEYEKLKANKSAKKKEGLLKNPVIQQLVTDSPTMSEKAKLEETVRVDNANRDFNLEGMKPQDSLTVIPKTNLNSDVSDVTTPLLAPSLTKNVPETYLKNAKKMLEKLGLEDYKGGVATVDSTQYTYEELLKIMDLLYGKSKKASSIKLAGNSLTFVKALEDRNLKRYVRNKIVFKFVNPSFKWWNLSIEDNK